MDAALRRPTTKRQALTHDGEAFADLPASQVQMQDAFFYKYFKGRRDKTLEMQEEDDTSEETDDAKVSGEESEEDMLEEDEEGEEGEEGEGEEGEEDSDALPDFMKKYMTYSYDKMGKDKDVLADFRQVRPHISIPHNTTRNQAFLTSLFKQPASTIILPLFPPPTGQGWYQR